MTGRRSAALMRATASAAISGWRIAQENRMKESSMIDEVSVFQGPLTDEEVVMLMNTGSTALPTPELPTLVLAGSGLAVAAVLLACRR